jgi:hypothetical protein
VLAGVLAAVLADVLADVLAGVVLARDACVTSAVIVDS